MATDYSYSSNTDDFRRLLAKQLAGSALDKTPIINPWQGVAKLADALFAGNLYGQERGDQEASDKRVNDFVPTLFGGTQPATTPQAAAPTAPTDAGTQYGPAISGIESGGRYDALGPVTKTGDRAYGKYQVMGANIPSWTKDVLGQEMTPDAFVADPKAQDAVSNAKFGALKDKYGPEGAARAWFAGEGGMNNPNASDVNGTTVAGYAQKFNTAMGGQPQQPAQDAAAPAAPDQSGQRAQALAIMLDPRVRPEVKALIQNQLFAEPKFITDRAGTTIAVNPRTFATTTIHQGPTPGVSLAAGSSLVNPVTGAPIAQGAPKDAPPGYTYNDPSNPGTGMTAIPGGEATRLPEQAAGHLAAMQTARQGLADARQTLLAGRGDSGAPIGGVLGAWTGAGETGRALRAVDAAVESALRLQSGAAVTPSELARYNDLYRPGPFDSPATVGQKLNNLQTFMNQAEANITQGRSASPQASGGGWVDAGGGVRIRPKP